MRAFKALNKDWTCKGFKYKVGKTYIHKGKISLCRSGFHASQKCSDVFNYYSFSPKKTIIVEVKLLGNVIHGNDKSVASKIKIIREIPFGEAVEKLCNSGDCNSGNCNSGNRNSGDRNSGDRNSGDRNSGDSNSGKWNSGDSNSGYWNSGNRNSGNRNSGKWNSGYWNSGDCNSGCFNTKEPEKILVFGKYCLKKDWGKIEKPSFLFFELETVVWVEDNHMTDQEKTEYQEYKTLGGYLKVLEDSYKDSWRISWETTTNKKEQLKQLKALPNFNAEMFEEISGLNVKKMEEDQ